MTSEIERRVRKMIEEMNKKYEDRPREYIHTTKPLDEKIMKDLEDRGYIVESPKSNVYLIHGQRYEDKDEFRIYLQNNIPYIKEENDLSGLILNGTEVQV